MKELGIESQYLSQSDGGVTRRVSKAIQASNILPACQVSLSSYSERDIIEAFRQKLENARKTSTKEHSSQVILHESYQVTNAMYSTVFKINKMQVVRRVMNAKRKFRGAGLRTVQGEKFTDLLQNLTKESEEKRRKQDIADNAKVNPANFR